MEKIITEKEKEHWSDYQITKEILDCIEKDVNLVKRKNQITKDQNEAIKKSNANIEEIKKGFTPEFESIKQELLKNEESYKTLSKIFLQQFKEEMQK